MTLYSSDLVLPDRIVAIGDTTALAIFSNKITNTIAVACCARHIIKDAM